MSTALGPAYPSTLGRIASRHALGWLVACNLVGVWLATILLWPGVGDLIEPLSYGRWMAVHLDGQLYGWCALPLVGVLMAWSMDFADAHAVHHAGLAFAFWSAALLLGAISWLAGVSSGKLFLDWHGWARPLLPVAILAIWGIMAGHIARRFRRGENVRAHVALLLALLPVPLVLWWSTSPGVYPPINPDSGGATGASLLGSTLAVIAVLGITPRLLGLRRHPDRGQTDRFWVFFAASVAVYAAINHGDRSHHELSQIAALTLLLVWIPLLIRKWRCYLWPAAAVRWRSATEAWWTALVVSGWIAFLPGVSERWKFSNALVGHAHLAMAGFVTSANGALLAALRGDDPRTECPRWAFRAWQAGCVVHVAVLLALGSVESRAPADVFLSAPWIQAAYAGRWAAGLAMLAGSIGWLQAAW